jgi:hypothetical protein
MKHPDREEWVPFLFGEANRETKQRLAQHLDSCPDCTREIEAWRRSLGKLEQWRLPKARTPTRFVVEPALKLALAATLALAAGLLIGRITVPKAANPNEIRASVEASVRSSLEAEMRGALEDLAARTSNQVSASELRVANASALETQRLWRGMLDVLNTTRTEDARAVQALLRRYQSQHDQEFVALRKDLETLASMTDDELRQARFNLIQLAASSSPKD